MQKGNILISWTVGSQRTSNRKAAHAINFVFFIFSFANAAGTAELDDVTAAGRKFEHCIQTIVLPTGVLVSS
jgi:hypothetical protein